MREYGSEHPAVILPDGFFDSLNEFGHCTWLRSGREALHLVALNIKANNEHPVVLMPAYCCHSMVDPFEKAGWGVVYYPLNGDLTADEQVLFSLLLSKQPRAVLTMNFFGSASTKAAIDIIKTEFPDCICIEDFSHCTFSIRSIFNPEVDYYVSSIRKSVGVCDGSVVISKHPLEESMVQDEETDFSLTRQGSQTIKRRYNYTQDGGSKTSFLIHLRQKEIDLDNFEGVHRISQFAKKQLASLNGKEIAFARRINMKHILGLLSGRIEMVPGIERCLDGAPFSLPIIVENRDEVQKKLALNGVYAPVLWPISDKARTMCSISAKMADKMLSIPIDQRYNYDDIEDIASIVLSTCK
jgi:hypothetical protein